MTEPDQASKNLLAQAGINPAVAEALAGAFAVTFVKHVIAALRHASGEGHDDPELEGLHLRVFSAIEPAIKVRVEGLTRQRLAGVVPDLTKVYREYLDGFIETRIELREVVRRCLEPLGYPLRPGLLSLLTPPRSKIKNGPAQFAKFAVGQLEHYHWKTVHTWSDANLNQEPFGIRVTPAEISDFITRFSDIDGLVTVLAKQLRAEASLEAALAILASIEGVKAKSTGQEASRSPVDREEQEEAAAKRQRFYSGKRGGPGRPRRKKG